MVAYRNIGVAGGNTNPTFIVDAEMVKDKNLPQVGNFIIEISLGLAYNYVVTNAA